MEENKLSHMMSMPTWSSRKVVSSQLEANEKVKNNSQECNEKGNREAEEGHGDVEETGRERLKRLREEVSMEDNKKVNIPENWGQEQKLKDWMDYTMFDAFFPHTMILTARDALIANARKAKSPRLY